MMNYTKVSEKVVEYVEQIPAFSLMVSNAVAEHFDRRIWNEDGVYSTTSVGGLVVISYIDMEKEAEGVITFYETYVQTKEEAVHDSTEYVDYEPWYKDALKTLLDEYDEELFEHLYPDYENCEEEDDDIPDDAIVFLVVEDAPAATLRIATVEEGKRYASVLTPHENILLKTYSLEEATKYYQDVLSEKMSNTAYLVIADIAAGTCRMQAVNSTVRRQSVLRGGESIYLDTSSIEEAARCFHEWDERFNDNELILDDCEDEELELYDCEDEE